VIALSGVNCVNSGAAAADLMKILETSQKANLELAEKIIKVANTAQVSQAEATGLGQVLDLYA
jgi:UTP-glucose-1-phosphate uridylyltransferase